MAPAFGYGGDSGLSHVAPMLCLHRGRGPWGWWPLFWNQTWEPARIGEDGQRTAEEGGGRGAGAAGRP